MLRVISAVAAMLMSAFAGTVSAQEYPTRPVSLIVPFAAGGPTDTLARNLAQQMSKTLKQQVIVENRAGAGGTLAAGIVAKSKPDGYQVLIAHIGVWLLKPGSFKLLSSLRKPLVTICTNGAKSNFLTAPRVQT